MSERYSNPESTEGFNQVSSIQQIIMSSINKICSDSNNEMHQGGHKVHIQSSSGWSEQYVPDYRDIYSNQVSFLIDTLSGKYPDIRTKEEEELIKLDNELQKVLKDNNNLINASSDKTKAFFDKSMISKYDVYRKLYREICKRLEDDNWLSDKGIEDE